MAFSIIQKVGNFLQKAKAVITSPKDIRRPVNASEVHHPSPKAGNKGNSVKTVHIPWTYRMFNMSLKDAVKQVSTNKRPIRYSGTFSPLEPFRAKHRALKSAGR